MSSASLQPSLWDMGTPLHCATFVVVDLETTGTTASDCITEIGAVKVQGGEVLGEFQTLVNPTQHIPALVSVLTGITNTMVASAPRLDAVLPQFLTFAQGCVIVAHNARFDVGFLRRACDEYGYKWSATQVIDTVALARHCLLQGEVPNVKLATLAQHFRVSVTPTHRALDDARATVDVLHALLARLGNQEISTVEDLQTCLRKVSPQKASKRHWVKDIPSAPGVYSFVRQGTDHREVLYVGKSANLRQRVSTYFTASESRKRMEEMVTVATGVDTTVCATALQAEITELRLIASHAPRYNRRSKYPERIWWLTLTDEKFPRFSLTKKRQHRSWGPFRQRSHGDTAAAAVLRAIPLRACTLPLTGKPTSACPLAEVGTCIAPCQGHVSEESYSPLVDSVCAMLDGNVWPAIDAAGHHIRRLVRQERFEEAATVRQHIEALVQLTTSHHRRESLANCPELVAAAPVATSAGREWDVHVIRYGRLAASSRARWGEDPRRVADLAVQTAETVVGAEPHATAAAVEETTLITRWLESSGARFLSTQGDWCWPVHASVSTEFLKSKLMATHEAASPASQ